jgi:exonuclease III
MALKAQIDASTVIVGDLNIPLSPIDKSSQQKTNNETSELLHTSDQIDMVDIYRIFHPTTRKFTFFSVPHEFLQNRSYFRTQSKSQQIQENQNNPLQITTE